MIFKRRKERAGDPAGEPDQNRSEPAGDEEPALVDPDAPPPVAGYDRSQGPLDIAEADDPDEERLDLGCLQIPVIDGLEIRVEVEQESNQPIAVTLLKGPGAVQVRAFAGPRSGGTWAEALRDVRKQITHDGGTVDQTDGPFGTELRATVPAQDEHGRTVMQQIRFVGVDGPRWMLQGILFGAGADPEAAAELEEVYRRLVVVRGDAAMPMGAQLPVVLPQQVPDDVAQDREDLDD